MFVDTSAWVAFFSRDDTFHTQVRQIINTYMFSQKPLYSSNYVFDETVTRLNTLHNWYYASKFIGFFNASLKSEALQRFWIDERIEDQAVSFLGKHSDHRLSLTDATIAILVKKHHIDTVLTTDGGFAKVGFTVLPQPLQ